MLEKNQRFKSLLYVLADAALLFIGFLLANYIRFNYVRYFEPGGAGPALAVARDPRNIIAGLATSLVLVLIYWVAGIYSTTRLRGLAERCTKIAVINAAGLLIFIGALYLMHLDDYSRIVLALFYILGTAGVVIERMILRWVDRARRRKGLGLRHILLVAVNPPRSICARSSTTPTTALSWTAIWPESKNRVLVCATWAAMMRCPPGSTRLPSMRSS